MDGWMDGSDYYIVKAKPFSQQQQQRKLQQQWHQQRQQHKKQHKVERELVEVDTIDETQLTTTASSPQQSIAQSI